MNDLPAYYNLPEEQRLAMLFIVRHIKDKGQSPTLQEIADARDRLVPAVHKTLKRLAKRGLIKIEPRQHRGITIIEEK